MKIERVENPPALTSPNRHGELQLAVLDLPIGGVLRVTGAKNSSLPGLLFSLHRNQPWKVVNRKQADGSNLLYKVSRNGSEA